MGMYDYINGEQVKCFYTPLFYIDDIIEDKCISYSGGSLTGFNTGDKVPIQTMYYNYSKDFVVYDYRNDNFAHVIKDGKVYETILLDDLSDEYLSFIFIDYYGNALNIKNKEDVFNIKKQFNILFEDKLNISLKIKENSNKRDEFIEQIKSIIQKFNEKWVVLEFENEKYFGELITTYIWLKENCKTTEEIDDFNLCKSLFIKALTENKNIINDYNNWSNFKYEELINNIKNKICNLS